MINTYDMKIFTPMTFYNLDKQQVVEYQLNIAESFNDIQRFDLDIPEIDDFVEAIIKIDDDLSNSESLLL